MGRPLPTFGLAIDWETSGYSYPNYADKHQGISFGAIIFDLKTLEPIDKLYKEIIFKESIFSWDFGAEKIHGLSKEYLKVNGISQEEAALDLGNLIIKYFGNEDIIILGHRVYFDKAFTNQLMNSIDINLNYNPTIIDTCSISNILLELSTSEEIFQALGLPARGKHNALEDIELTLLTMKKIKNIFFNGLLAELNT